MTINLKHLVEGIFCSKLKTPYCQVFPLISVLNAIFLLNFRDDIQPWFKAAGSVDEVKRMKPVHAKMKTSLEHKFNGLCTARNSILNDIVFTVTEVKAVQNTVLDGELINWKREQQLAGNGKAMSMSLESLQVVIMMLIVMM